MKVPSIIKHTLWVATVATSASVSRQVDSVSLIMTAATNVMIATVPLDAVAHRMSDLACTLQSTSGPVACSGLSISQIAGNQIATPGGYECAFLGSDLRWFGNLTNIGDGRDPYIDVSPPQVIFGVDCWTLSVVDM